MVTVKNRDFFCNAYLPKDEISDHNFQWSGVPIPHPHFVLMWSDTENTTVK